MQYIFSIVLVVSLMANAYFGFLLLQSPDSSLILSSQNIRESQNVLAESISSSAPIMEVVQTEQTHTESVPSIVNNATTQEAAATIRPLLNESLFTAKVDISEAAEFLSDLCARNIPSSEAHDILAYSFAYIGIMSESVITDILQKIASGTQLGDAVRSAGFAIKDTELKAALCTQKH